MAQTWSHRDINLHKGHIKLNQPVHGLPVPGKQLQLVVDHATPKVELPLQKQLTLKNTSPTKNLNTFTLFRGQHHALPHHALPHGSNDNDHEPKPAKLKLSSLQ